MFSIVAFYKFARLSDARVSEISTLLEQWAEELSLYGLVILGSEGINSTMSAEAGNLQEFCVRLQQLSEFSEIIFKHSVAERPPFKRFKIKIRPEIVTIKNEAYFADRPNHHISPAEWNAMIERGDCVLVDTRNDYEVELGTFEGAVDPKLKMFSEFPDFVRQSGIPKEKNVLMFCTGGIRCEKAIYEMQQQGYQNVYQLEGGILKYLEEYPNQKFKGDCFVFDHRVAVNQELRPALDVHLCPHCGNPGKLVTSCLQCGGEAKVCSHCAEQKEHQTCSKNCAHHYLRGHSSVI